MQQQSNSDQSYSDEIDLADLVRSLWNGKWLVIGVTFVTVVLAVAYLKLTPKTYTGSLEIEEISHPQFEEYRDLAEFGLSPVSSEQLRNLYVEEILEHEGIEQVIQEINYLPRNEEETDAEYNFRVRKAAYAFQFVPPSEKGAKSPQLNWVLQITTHDPILASQLVHSAFSIANEKVNQFLQTDADRTSAINKKILAYAIEDIATAEKNAVNQYKMELAAQIAYLQEQALLAHSIDVDKTTFSAQNFNAAATVVTSVDQNQPFYLRGFIAIEQDIDMLQNRVSPIPFIPKLIGLAAQRDTLLGDKTIERAAKAVQQSPIGSERFVAANYDLASIEYKSKTKSLLVLALAVVLGGMLGIFVLLIRNALIKKD